MSKTLTPSTPAPTEEQIQKLCDKIRAAVRRSRLTSQHFQNGLAYPGTSLEDEILTSVVRFSKKASGIFNPVAAIETGLVPRALTVKSDDLEGDIDLTRLDFFSCPVREKEPWNKGITMMERAKTAQAIGSLGFAKLVLDAQAEGKDIIPAELRGNLIILPRTILDSDNQDRDTIGYMTVHGGRWEMYCSLVAYFPVHCRDFYNRARFVRLHELPAEMMDK